MTVELVIKGTGHSTQREQQEVKANRWVSCGCDTRYEKAEEREVQAEGTACAKAQDRVMKTGVLRAGRGLQGCWALKGKMRSRIGP